MKEQFIIQFKQGNIRYQAEVKAHDFVEIRIYDVYYSIVPYVHPARKVQIYAGSGVGPVTYWRQRLTKIDEELLPKEFIEQIGFAIEQVKL